MKLLDTPFQPGFNPVRVGISNIREEEDAKWSQMDGVESGFPSKQKSRDGVAVYKVAEC